MVFSPSKKVPISRLNARGKDFFEKMIHTIPKWFTFHPCQRKLSKNPDTFHQLIPKPQTTFPPFSPIFPSVPAFLPLFSDYPDK
jgi:hypothetical protein